MKKILISLMVHVCFTVTISAQSLNYFELPECGDYCVSVMRSGTDNIYIYRPNPDDMMYEFSILTTGVIENDVSGYENLLNASFDFAPLTNNQIVFTSGGMQTSYEPYLLDLESQQITLLNHDIPEIVSPCAAINGVSAVRYIFRYDDRRVLLCTKSADHAAYVNIARLENDNLVFEHRFRIGGYGDVAAYPTTWFSIVSGLDGNIYIVPTSGNSVLNAVSPSSRDSLDFDTIAVMGYDLRIQEWSVNIVDFPPSRPRLVESNRLREIHLIGVDELGNLYFLEWVRAENYSIVASSITKFMPNGEQLWELTEVDFDNHVFGNSLVVSDNQLVVNFLDGNVVIIEIN